MRINERRKQILMKVEEYPGGPPYTCPECGSNDWETHNRTKRSFGEVKILKCKICEYIDG